METAQGRFSGLEMASQPGLPGLATINQIGGPGTWGLDRETLNELTTYAEESNYDQALSEATKSSRTDMLAAVPPQLYLEDTRNSKWTITQSSNGFATNAEVNAYLASAQAIDLKTTRITATMQITVPLFAGVAAADIITIPNLAPLMCFSYGLQIGGNGNTLQDVGTMTDQPWLTNMRAAKRPFDKSDLIISSNLGWELQGFQTEPGTNNYATASLSTGIPIKPADAAETTVTNTFTIRPTHPFFGIEKSWPPNIPLKLIIKWNDNLSKSLLTFKGALAGTGDEAVAFRNGVVINLQIHTIRSEELWLAPPVKSFIMSSFNTDSVTNMNQLAAARTATKDQLFDPNFGFQAFPKDIGGIFQFETFRLSSHTAVGSTFTIHPVLNGSARPKFMVIGFPNPNIAYSAGLNPDPTTPTTTLQNIQILYNGQTVWDEPYQQNTNNNDVMESLYAESKRYAGAEHGLGFINSKWWAYDSWFQDNSWIVVKLAPSHNENEIQPNQSAPVEIRGQFTAALPNAIQIRVGLFFDQTMVIQKNNQAVFALPIY